MSSSAEASTIKIPMNENMNMNTSPPPQQSQSQMLICYSPSMPAPANQPEIPPGAIIIQHVNPPCTSSNRKRGRGHLNLSELLFPQDQPITVVSPPSLQQTQTHHTDSTLALAVVKKHRGRPKGSKNKKKKQSTDPASIPGLTGPNFTTHVLNTKAEEEKWKAKKMERFQVSSADQNINESEILGDAIGPNYSGKIGGVRTGPIQTNILGRRASVASVNNSNKELNDIKKTLDAQNDKIQSLEERLLEMERIMQVHFDSGACSHRFRVKKNKESDKGKRTLSSSSSSSYDSSYDCDSDSNP